jgi:hypothetical protein
MPRCRCEWGADRRSGWLPLAGCSGTALLPLALVVLRVEEGRVVEVVHWDRPELSEAFGLPMRFRPLRGCNEYEVNAKEVR